MPHCRSQPMPSFGSLMPPSVGRIYGPTEGWNPFHQRGGWAMNGWEWWETDRKSTRLNQSQSNLVCRLLLEKKKAGDSAGIDGEHDGGDIREKFVLPRYRGMDQASEQITDVDHDGKGDCRRGNHADDSARV